MSEISFDMDPGLSGVVRVGLVWAEGIPACPRSGAASAYLAEVLGRVRSAGESFLAQERKAAVRSMLRHGKYRPAGRAKPSSEYLLSAALEPGDPASGASADGGFPLVNGPVDANNAVSLAWGWPASIFDTALSGSAFFLRRGLPGESYVFNASGQTIDLEDLLVVCRRMDDPDAEDGFRWEPCGNPVKDSMATKVFEGCHDVAAVLFAPASERIEDLEAACDRFVRLLKEDCGASSGGWRILG